LPAARALLAAEWCELLRRRAEGTYAAEGATAPTACAAGSEAPEAGQAACIEIVTSVGTSVAAPVPVLTPSVQQLQCTLAEPAAQLSAGATHEQAYELSCTLAGTVSVSAVVTITSGHRHISLAVAAADVTVAAGPAQRMVLHLKLTPRERTLLRARARVFPWRSPSTARSRAPRRRCSRARRSPGTASAPRRQARAGTSARPGALSRAARCRTACRSPIRAERIDYASE